MCIIHLFPAGIDVNWDGLRNGSYVNDDGHGWAIASSAGLQVGKSMKYSTAEQALWDALPDHGSDRIVMFHSRFGTHGVEGEENIHPFYTDESGLTVMSHNGILPGSFHPTKWDRRSDTRIFVDRIVPGYLNEGYGVPSRRSAQALGAMIGRANKLVFLSVKSGKPKARLVNASCGVQEGGAWYSNDGFRSYWQPTWRTPYTGGGRGPLGWDWDETPSVIGAKPTGEVWVNDEVCEYCGIVGHVNHTLGQCMACESCLECGLRFDEGCMCYVPESTRRKAEVEYKEQLALPAGEST